MQRLLPIKYDCKSFVASAVKALCLFFSRSALSVPLSTPTYCYFYIYSTQPDVTLSSATNTPSPFSDEVFATSNLEVVSNVSGIRGARK